MKYTGIVNVNLEYVFEAKDKEDAEIYLQNVELPKEYVEDSFDLVKILDDKGNEI